MKFIMTKYTNCVVYKITNKINQKNYIGSTNNYKRRMREHRAAINYSPDHRDFYHPLYQAFRKYGIENFTFEILSDNISGIKKVRQIEEEFIKSYNSLAPNGYNLREKTIGLSEYDIQKLIEKTGNKCALVDEEENIIKIYNSLREAERNEQDQATQIAKVCKGLLYSTNGRLYRYIDENLQIVPVDNYKQLRPQEYVIIGILAEDTNNVKYYKTVQAAADDNNISKTVIFKCLKGETRFSICGGRIWRRVDNNNNIIENNLPIQQVIENFNKKYILHNGERKTLASWCKYYKIPYDAVRYQINTKKRKFEEVIQEFINKNG